MRHKNNLNPNLKINLLAVLFICLIEYTQNPANYGGTLLLFHFNSTIETILLLCLPQDYMIVGDS